MLTDYYKEGSSSSFYSAKSFPVQFDQITNDVTPPAEQTVYEQEASQIIQEAELTRFNDWNNMES